MHIISNSSIKIPKLVLKYLKGLEELTSDLIKNLIS